MVCLYAVSYTHLTFFGRMKNEMYYGSEKEYTSFKVFAKAVKELSLIHILLKKEDPHAEKSDDETLHQALSGLLNRMREMIIKETEILVPMVQKLVDQNEWPLIAGDFPRFGWAYLTRCV